MLLLLSMLAAPSSKKLTKKGRPLTESKPSLMPAAVAAFLLTVSHRVAPPVNRSTDLITPHNPNPQFPHFPSSTHDLPPKWGKWENSHPHPILHSCPMLYQSAPRIPRENTPPASPAVGTNNLYTPPHRIWYYYPEQFILSEE